MASVTYFRDPRVFSLMAAEMATVVATLNQGRTGGNGTAAIHAGARGYRITLNGRLIAKGSTPRELHAAFKAAVAKACEGKPS